jgi:ribonucleoside-triphosphate reductase
MIDRVVGHQMWLWDRASVKAGYLIDEDELKELSELRQLMVERKVSMSGRTNWLGGTDVSKKREASQFNCSFLRIETVRDVVDAIWLLLQGCGVGFSPVVGQLTGFQNRIPEIEFKRSTRTSKGGREHNVETLENGVWTINIGDSAEAWAKAVGKLVAHPHTAAHKLVVSTEEIRPAGERLKGYGWISSGDDALVKALEAIFHILNRRAGSLLTRIDILDIANWLGTVLSSRRSAEIAIFEYGQDEWQEFAVAKKDFWVNNLQRAQSNNSLLFKKKPTLAELEHIFHLMVEAGGSEPGFINGEAATKRAPWFAGTNPCCEILLGSKSFCNLVEIDVSKFFGDSAGLRRAVEIAARANYRQTCVDLNDGILQEDWHRNNDFLRLCGVGLTGIAMRPDLKPYDYSELQRTATYAAYSMADELGTPRPKNITTIKPSGTLSKVFDCTEGMHKPLGRYIFNQVNFSKHDPLVSLCRSAGYKVIPNPMDPEAMLITLPVKWDNVPFSKIVKNGVEMEVNLETAIEQLERYKLLMLNYCQQNVSSTISYSVDEVPAIIDWLLENWDNYIGVSFLFRTDPTMTAEDLGYAYIPQSVVTKAEYEAYVANLQPIDLNSNVHSLDAELEDECKSGACPIR